MSRRWRGHSFANASDGPVSLFRRETSWQRAFSACIDLHADREYISMPSKTQFAKSERSLPIKDKNLFREQCYVDGDWIDADSGNVFPVNNPADGSILGTVPELGAAEVRHAIEAADAALPVGKPNSEGTIRKFSAAGLISACRISRTLATILTLEQGKPLAGGARRNCLRLRIHRMVCRGSKARLWRRYPAQSCGPADRCAQAAHRSSRRHHALEFPQCDDHAQSRSSACGRLHDRDQAGRIDAIFRARACGVGGAGGNTKGSVQCRHGRSGSYRRRTYVEPRSAQALVHGFHGGRAASCCSNARAR